MNDYDHIIKLIIIGESGVGKSTLLSRYCDGTFNENYISTIGVDFRIKRLEINDKKIKLQVWDTAGQERFKSISLSYYRGAHAIMLVFDLTNTNSFNKLNQWIKDIDRNLTNDKYKIILIGNKCENENNIVVNRDDINSFVQKYNMEYMEVSAKKNINVDLAFTRITDLVFKSMMNTKVSNKFNLVHKKEKKNKCC